MNKSLTVLGAIMMVTSCATSMSYLPLNSGYDPKPLGCQLDVYTPSQMIKKNYVLIGELVASDTGFSINCGPEEVMRSIKDMACSKGADAIYLYGSSHASQSTSTCFQTNVKFIAYE